jgi:hypothetical protein
MHIFKEIVVNSFKLLAQYVADEIEINLKVLGQNKRNLAEFQSMKFRKSVPCSCSFTDPHDYKNIECFCVNLRQTDVIFKTTVLTDRRKVATKQFKRQ